jgi:hypothetical protein
VPLEAIPASRKSLLLPVDGRLSALLSAAMMQARDTLPTYMIPISMVPIVEIPITVQGKIDRRRLIAEYNRLTAEDLTRLGGEQNDDQVDSSDWTLTEKAISNALLQTLGDASIPIKRGTSFLGLGVDSISAIAFSRRISKALGQDIPVSAVLRNPSVVRLSHWLTTSDVPNRSRDAVLAPLLPTDLVRQAQEAAAKAGVEISAVLPCTPLQEAMLSSSSSDASAYRNTLRFRVSGDADFLMQCWKQMFTRHDILRTTFIQTSDSTFPFLQIVLEHAQFPLTEETTLSRDTAGEDLPQALGSLRPPVHFSILRTESLIFLHISCHHALYDGTAMTIMLNEVEELYHRRTLPPTISAAPFLREVVAQRDVGHLDFWRGHLEGLQPTILRADGRAQSSVSRHVTQSLTSLEVHCRELSASLLSLCQTAWAKTISNLFESSDICFGNVVSGRGVLNEPLDKLVAPTFNTVPLRIDLRQHLGNTDAMKATQRINAASLSHQLCPLRSIQSSLGFTETGLFSSILLLQQSDLELDQSIWALEHESGVMDVSSLLQYINCLLTTPSSR